MTDAKTMERGIRFVLAMMRSASTDKINPKKWWERARSALETSAASADEFGAMVSVMGRKLQIDVANFSTADEIDQLMCELEDCFEPFRALCERQALYIVALAQARRHEQRQKDLFTKEGQA